MLRKLDMGQTKVLLEEEKTKLITDRRWGGKIRFENRKRNKQEAGTNRWQRIQHVQRK